MTGSIGKSRPFAEVGLVVMWSSGFIGAKLGTQEASTPTFQAWRSLFAAGVLLAAVLLLRRCWPSQSEVAVQGTVGFLAQGLYLSGVVGAVEFGVNAGTAALVAALQPLLAAALASPVLGEHVRGRQWVGLIVGLVGVVLVVSGDMRVKEQVPAESSWRAGARDGRWAGGHLTFTRVGSKQIASPQLCKPGGPSAAPCEARGLCRGVG